MFAPPSLFKAISWSPCQGRHQVASACRSHYQLFASWQNKKFDDGTCLAIQSCYIVLKMQGIQQYPAAPELGAFRTKIAFGMTGLMKE